MFSCINTNPFITGLYSFPFNYILLLQVQSHGNLGFDMGLYGEDVISSLTTITHTHTHYGRSNKLVSRSVIYKLQTLSEGQGMCTNLIDTCTNLNVSPRTRRSF